MTDKPNIAQFWKLAGFNQPLILASSSPRRADILQSIGCPFEIVIPPDVEGVYGTWDGGELLERWAVQKASIVCEMHPGRIILSADTVVRLGDQIFGKPDDAAEARRVLFLLSGREHEVWSAMCLIKESAHKIRSVLSRTTVRFRHLSSGEIDAYITTGEPLDKAGAYGIQGIGGLWVESLEGCYYNVVGLPLSRLWELIKTF